MVLLLILIILSLPVTADADAWDDYHGPVLVGAFIATLGAWSDDGYLDLGLSQVGSEMSSGLMLALVERVDDKYDFTLGYITPQEFDACGRVGCRWYVDEQIFAGVELTVKKNDRLRLGIGPYFFQSADRVVSSNFRVGLSLEYRINDRFGLKVRHFSNAGTGKELTLCRDRETWENVRATESSQSVYCQTNRWNTGQDSWLRVVWYF